MVAIRALYLTVFFLVAIYLSAVGSAAAIDRNFGNLDVRIVSIPDGDHHLSGLLYRPVGATVENPLPAVVLVHGLSGFKQMMSGTALELARHGFVTLVVDLVGHGNSEGQFGLAASLDPTLGALSSVHYLESQPFVDASSIGLVCHSLGAGAVRATAAAHRNIAASVFIAGGIGGMVTGPSYGILNSTFPGNLLIAVGQHDILFNVDQLDEELAPAFGAQDIIPYRLYGDFSARTARKLITPATTHLFEPIDPSITSEIVSWMSNAMGLETQNQLSPIYLFRESALSIGVLALVAFVFPVPLIIFFSFPRAVNGGRPRKRHGALEDWKLMMIWGLLGLILFTPTFAFGSLIPFPLFSSIGSSIASWLFSVGISGLAVIRFLLPRVSTVKLDLRSVISDSFDRYQVSAALVLFMLLFITANLIEALFLADMRIFVIPVFNDLKPGARILAFLLLLPFFLVYFFAEGLFLHELSARQSRKHQVGREVLAMSKAIALKITPYVLVICAQYVPMFLLNFRLFSGFSGFIVMFFWGFVPLFVITTACSWWLYRCSSKIGTGAIFNALLFAWSAAANFPLGSLAAGFHS